MDDNNQQVPSKNASLVETKKISKEEAEKCASEQISHIGTIQPHGFVLVVDLEKGHIVQYSDNLISMINQTRTSPLSYDTPILNTHLNDWIECDYKTIFQSLYPSSSQIIKLSEKGIISSQDFECMCSKQEAYALFEFFSSAAEQQSSQILSNFNRVVSRIRASKDVQELFDNMTSEFQQHTLFDRVMIYRFLPDGSGEVVSEAVSERAQVEFLGLRFPAEDIPKQARELYKTSALRMIADVDAIPSKLVPALLPDGSPLDQSINILRSMSKMHVMYLKNMGVIGSMSISLMADGELWGLLSCHNYSVKTPPLYLISEMIASCQLFAEIASLHTTHSVNLDEVKRVAEAKEAIMLSFLQHKQDKVLPLTVFNDLLRQIHPRVNADYIGILLNEDCFISSKKDEWVADEQLANKLKNLLSQSENNCFTSNKLLVSENQIVLSTDLRIAGLLIIQSKLIPELAVFFAANEVISEVNWGGEPETVNIVIKDGERQLEPRSSFALWRQKVEGQSQEWLETDKDILLLLLAEMNSFCFQQTNQKIKESLYETSFKDTLTGLYNRRYLEGLFNKSQSRAESVTDFTVFFIDLDNFKRINDFLGHTAGDALLVEIAKRLIACVRPGDLVIRLGGDEFIVLINHENKGLNIQAVSEKVAKKIISTISQPVFFNDHPMVTTPSIGAVISNINDCEFSQILQQADIAMYNAKNEGKNKVHFFSEKDKSKVVAEGELERELRACIENNEIQVYYQSQVTCSTKKVIGCEALARWKHPKLGFVSPPVFISLAEKLNIIDELSYQIIEKSFIQLSRWYTDGKVNQLKTLSINISPSILMRSNFEQKVLLLLEKYGLSPSMVRLEITETLFMENFEQAIKALTDLRRSGFSISLDDFGTGFSSLSYLKRLPIDEVKIDQSFIINMDEDDNSLTMVEGIISLCKKMDLEVVAEGVEEKIHSTLLRAFGCDVCQGYYYSRPVAAEDFVFDIQK